MLFNRMNWIVLTSLILFLNASFSVLADEEVAKKPDFYKDSKRGYWWYEVPPVEEDDVEEEIAKPKPQVAAPPPAETTLTPIEQLKSLGKQWENDMATAILNPNEKTMSKWMDVHTRVLQQADTFSDQFQKNTWKNPKYDYRLSKPVDRVALVENNAATAKKADSTLAQLSTEKGLIFFYRSDCPYCKKFSPVLKKFTSQFGFTVIPVSLDGPGIPDYPYPKRPDAILAKIDVPVVPALFMVDPKDNTVAPVSYGFADWTTLTKKMVYAGTQMNVRNVSAVMEGNQ